MSIEDTLPPKRARPLQLLQKLHRHDLWQIGFEQSVGQIKFQAAPQRHRHRHLISTYRKRKQRTAPKTHRCLSKNTQTVLPAARPSPSTRLSLRTSTSPHDLAHMPANLRDLSPFKGKPLWEPEDDEWAEMDAKHISSTFKASFKDPGQYSPRKATTSTGTLSRLTTTLTSFLPSSPTKRASDAVLREEEALRDNLEELQNTYYSNPDGDLCDTVMKSVFLSGSRYFHNTSSSVRIPHVIDLEAYFTTQDPLVEAAYPRLSDAIATILSHTDRDCVEAFLDPRVEEFVYRREVNRSAAGSIIVVRRKGNQIIVSYPSPYFPLHSRGK
jgi:hypothetical protein